jgi:arginyl-tRNA synthetase
VLRPCQASQEAAGRCRELIAGCAPIAGVAKLELAGAGYINFFFDRAAVMRGSLADLKPQTSCSARRRGQGDRRTLPISTRTKPRTSAICATRRSRHFCAHHEGSGRPVEVQNYIDNTGVQVADCHRRFSSTSKKKSLAECRR